MQSALYVMAVVAVVVGGVAAMDQAMKDYILKVHNDYRAEQGASNMAKLEWDATMESEAQAWAANCEFKHKGMGENLAWNSMTETPEKELIDKAMKSFYDEKDKYSYGQRSCGTSSACHYTQLVWAKTRKVGCATQVCQPLRGAYNKAWFLVCRYEPNGNWDGKKPFEKGQACSACPGATCEGGLCVGGSTEEEVCEDRDDQCASWADRGECDNNPEFMHKSCKKSCNKC